MTGREIVTRVRAYSPLRLFIGMVANFTATRRYKKAVRFCPVSKSTTSSLAHNGFLVSSELIGSAEMAMLKAEIEDIFQSSADPNAFVSVVKGRYVRGLIDSAETLYLSEKAIPYKRILSNIYKSNLFAELESLHGCEFYCRTVAAFKTTARDETPEGSFRFHRDGHPPFSYKILLYVSDVESLDKGPTSYVPESVLSIIPGFGSYRFSRPISPSMYEKNVVLGKSGTMLLFNNNGLHAGGRTRKGERIVVTMQFVPKYSREIHKYSASTQYRFGQLEYDIV